MQDTIKTDLNSWNGNIKLVFCRQNVDKLNCQLNVCTPLRQIADKMKAMDIMVTNYWYFVDKIQTF